MLKRSLGPVLASLIFAVLGAAAPARAADNYAVDPMHSSVYFKISHLGLTNVFGRFDEFSGNFTLDPDDAGKCSFGLTIKTESVDTNNPKRDSHLRSPDFFNVKQFPALTFKSTAVKAVEGGYQVTGDLEIHGVKKAITVPFTFKKTATGGVFASTFTVNRNDFKLGKPGGDVGEQIKLDISVPVT